MMYRGNFHEDIYRVAILLLAVCILVVAARNAFAQGIKPGSSMSPAVYDKNRDGKIDESAGGTGVPGCADGQVLYHSGGSWGCSSAGSGNMNTVVYDPNSDGVIGFGNGGTGLSAVAAGNTIVSNGSTWNTKAVSDFASSGANTDITGLTPSAGYVLKLTPVDKKVCINCTAPQNPLDELQVDAGAGGGTQADITLNGSQGGSVNFINGATALGSITGTSTALTLTSSGAVNATNLKINGTPATALDGVQVSTSTPGTSDTKLVTEGYVAGNPKFSATSSVGLASGTGIRKVPFNTEDYDIGKSGGAGDLDHATNYRFTPTRAGKYHLSAGLYFVATAGGQLSTVYIYKNGASHKRVFVAHNSTPLATAINISVDVVANGSTDYFEVYADSSTTYSVISDAGTYFTGHYIGN